MEAKHAREISDAVNAPNPEKTLKIVFDSVMKAAKHGKYSDWLVVRAIDLEAVRPALESLGYSIDVQPGSHDDDKRLLGLTW